MSEKLLSEYQCVLREIEMIKNRAAVIKDVTQDRLKCAKNEEEKENIFIDFKTQLHKIKKDKNIKHKYKNLVKRKEIIETEMLGKMSDEKPSKSAPKHIPVAKNSQPKPKKVKPKIESPESDSSDDITSIKQTSKTIDINDDINDLINKYQQKVVLDEPTPTKRHKKTKRVIKSESSESSYCSEDKNTTIIVNVPNNCNNNCNTNGGGGNNNRKHNPYVDSGSDSDRVVVIPKKPCLDDTKQVRKLCNLIKDLQCEIDK
jgi:hypothetical protein